MKRDLDRIMKRYDGGCHCGAIGFHFRTSKTPSDWSIRACQCSFCRAHGALSTSDPDGKVEYIATDAGKLQRYRFGLRTADFLLCKECGVYVGAVLKTTEGSWGIINTRALYEGPIDMSAVEPSDYDGEDTSGRIKRREDRWTPASEQSKQPR